MDRLTRRALLLAAALAVLAVVVVVTGLPHHVDGPHTESTALSDEDVERLTGWERSTDCEPEGDSVVAVRRVRTDLPFQRPHLHYAEVSSEEQAIANPVTGEGGYATCDLPAAFDRFVERIPAHSYHDGARTRLYLERGGIFYGLYVERGDVVLAS